MVGTDNSGSGAATAFGGSLPSSVGGGGGVYNARDASMDGLDCLQDISFFPGGPQMPPLPDYSDLTYAVSHMQVRSGPLLHMGQHNLISFCEHTVWGMGGAHRVGP